MKEVESKQISPQKLWVFFVNNPQNPNPAMTSRAIGSSISAENSAKVSDRLETLLSVPGALVTALGNWKTGQCLAKAGRDSDGFPNSKIETAVQYNSEVIKAKLRAASALQLDEAIDDVMISLPKQWHIIKLISAQDLFLYIALDRSNASISSAGLKLMQAKKELTKVFNQRR